MKQTQLKTSNQLRCKNKLSLTGRPPMPSNGNSSSEQSDNDEEDNNENHMHLKNEKIEENPSSPLQSSAY
jgi:hypothetical protein